MTGIPIIFCFSACSHHCDFEQGTCGWENEADNEVGCSWNVRKGQGLTPDSGPFFDHTYGSPNGTYLYFHSSYCDQAALNHGVSASLQIKGYAQKFICLKFWYQMYGGGSSYQITVSQSKFKFDMLHVDALCTDCGMARLIFPRIAVQSAESVPDKQD